MYKNKTIGAIILAAGVGSRMGSHLPKQFLKIDGKPMIAKTVSAFEQSQHIDGFFIVTGEDYLDYVTGEMSQMKKLQGVVAGGAERRDSVKSGLEAIKKSSIEYEYILVHDGARPYVTTELIERVTARLVEESAGGVIPVVPVKDTVKHTEGEKVKMTLPRSELALAQTPQGFPTDLIYRAYEEAEKLGLQGTDDSALVEAMGENVLCVEGSYENIKITTREDMPMESRIGTGYDVHRFEKGRVLVLGGVEIPYEMGLLGHSDADVLTHAVMDALLGAAGMGDIGEHFPDTNPEYKGISSMILLEKVGKLIAEKGYRIVNIDATIVAQAPKMAPHIQKMRENIGDRLRMEAEMVNIKATTTEGLGFVGRKEGIAASAVCIIM